MKKMTILMALAMCVATAAFADGMAPMMGKIKSVEMANAQNMMKPQLVIVDAAGKESKLALSAATAITDKAGKALTLDKLTAGESVKVSSTAQGVSSVQVES